MFTRNYNFIDNENQIKRISYQIFSGKHEIYKNVHAKEQKYIKQLFLG